MTGLPCPPEHSEGPVWKGVEMLRYAQHDRVVLLPRPRGRPGWGSYEVVMFSSFELPTWWRSLYQWPGLDPIIPLEKHHSCNIVRHIAR